MAGGETKRIFIRLLGKYRDKKGKDFSLRHFQDDLIKKGGPPLAVVKWVLLDDRSSLDQAVK